MHCAVDLKWGEAETMAMKKTWQGFEKQPTSITSLCMAPKIVHKKVDVCREAFTTHVKHVVSSVFLEAWSSPLYQSQRKTGLLCTGWLSIISSSCALCDTYKPVKAKYAVFE